ncbi:epoxyqueuosine reductase, partial [Candidatus Hydrogenedentota bacterium]
SIVVCIRYYGKYRLPEEPLGHIGKYYLADQRMPLCPDYQLPLRMEAGFERLDLRYKAAKVPDRWAAARAGFTRTAEHGTWVNIDTWVVETELTPDEPTLDIPCPPDCRACIDACPTGALVEPFVMRMDHCIANLSYHTPHPIQQELWEKMGGWIYGCDACQDACPMNKGKWVEQEDAFWQFDVAEHLSPEALANMDEGTYRTIVYPRFWYNFADEIARWHANAKRALKSKRER